MAGWIERLRLGGMAATAPVVSNSARTAATQYPMSQISTLGVGAVSRLGRRRRVRKLGRWGE